MPDWPDIPELWQLSEYFGERWEAVYQGLDVQGEIGKMAEWLEANPRRRPRNYKRFMVRWLNRAHGQVERSIAAEFARHEIRRQNAVINH